MKRTTTTRLEPHSGVQGNALGQDGYADLFNGATFMPIDKPSRIQMLLEEVWKIRQAALLAFCLKLSEQDPELYSDTGLSDCFHVFLGLPPKVRQRVTEYPPFRIWLKKSTRAVANSSASLKSRESSLKARLGDLRRIMDAFQESESKPSALIIPETTVAVERFSVDPLIAEVAPPTYEFPDEHSQHEREERTAYHLPFFLEVATTALGRIKESWPAAYRDFGKFVRMIIHLTDGNFRSCSAERYAGVIFLSADDETLLDLEESLIHEYGHQILYNVMELDPLLVSDAKVSFKLPWSGAERDFYGYFHAFYIYILLTLYYERLNGHSEEERERAAGRMAHILRGLQKALPDFEAADNFTPRGRELFETLKGKVHQLEKRHQHLL